MRSNPSRWTRAALLSAAVALPAACARESDAPSAASQPLVTDVDHTMVKRQSIGNCWLYAQATWLESLFLTNTGEEIDVSESYWTWWHWYEQIVGSSIQEIQTGGSWSVGNGILRRHGFVLEGEFIRDEEGQEMSTRQAAALAAVNAALRPGGALATSQSRTAENVTAVLDQAFGTDMRTAQSLARPAQTTPVGQMTVAQHLQSWKHYSWPQVYGQDAVVPQNVQQSRAALLQRTLRALNDGHPVVMTFLVDFNALDVADKGSFKKALLDQRGPGTQAGHLVVLEDYTVRDAPGYGDIGEGEVSDEMKAAALQGTLTSIKAKNSWGFARADRGIVDGHTRFDADYLFGQTPWKQDTAGTQLSWHSALLSLVLPPGY